MTYVLANALQRAVFLTLSQDPGVAAAVGTAVFDAAPSGAVPEVFVALGPERVDVVGDSGGAVARHVLTISVLSQETGGFARAKAAAAAVSEALDGATPGLDRGRVLSIRFLRADARRPTTGGRRRIDLRFEARVEDQ